MQKSRSFCKKLFSENQCCSNASKHRDHRSSQPTVSSPKHEHGVSQQCNALHHPLQSNEVELKCGCKIPVIVDGRQNQGNTSMPVTKGWIGDKPVSVLRYTGCSTIVVWESVVSEKQLTGGSVLCVLIDRTVRRTPVANIEIQTPYLSGMVKAVCMKQPLYDLIVGDVEGVKEEIPTNNAKAEGEILHQQGQATETRGQKKRQVRPLSVPSPIETDIPLETTVKLQGEDESLKNIRDKVQPGRTSGEPHDSNFLVCNNLIYRHNQKGQAQFSKQLVLLVSLRASVMKLAHETIMGGHQGISHTLDRVSSQFWWPGMTGDVNRYCKSCDICQRTVVKGRTPKVSLGNVPLIDTPFKRIAVDIVGPIFPVSDRGNRYLLTLVDYATRYPEAVALKNVETKTLAEALVSIFARVGVPTEILSDQGAQFMSHVMKEVCRLLLVKQLTTTPYYP